MYKMSENIGTGLICQGYNSSAKALLSCWLAWNLNTLGKFMWSSFSWKIIVNRLQCRVIYPVKNEILMTFEPSCHQATDCGLGFYLNLTIPSCSPRDCVLHRKFMYDLSLLCYKGLKAIRCCFQPKISSKYDAVVCEITWEVYASLQSLRNVSTGINCFQFWGFDWER